MDQITNLISNKISDNFLLKMLKTVEKKSTSYPTSQVLILSTYIYLVIVDKQEV